MTDPPRLNNDKEKHMKNTTALIELADYVEKIEPERFDMNWWWSGHDVTTGRTLSCGTVGCAIGHGIAAGKVPAGLTLVDGLPVFNDAGLQWQAYRGVAAAFGITMSEAEHAFDPASYEGDPSPETVAKRIRAVAWA